MKIELDVRNLENVGDLTDEKLQKFKEIFEVLIATGSLSGVRNGKTILHFDHEAVFQGVQVDYMPWKRRKVQ